MKHRKIISYFVGILLLLSYSLSGWACSMYKVTRDHATVVGCNEDAWRTTSRIWFENAKNNDPFGAAFTGSRQVGHLKFAPQSGMNEAGLVFSRLAAYHPEMAQKDKQPISDEVQFLKDIMHTCMNIEEVKQYVTKYDRSIFLQDVLIYVDSSGDYLVVEPYETIEGHDLSYVLTNFNPSLTSHEDARKITRYRNGVDYLQTHGLDTALDYCVAMSDTMHVCRNHKGDGTLLTSIWNTQKGLVNLYFYHQYDATIQYNISEELAQGDHTFVIPSMFPKNAEFEQLTDYKTPFNVPAIRVGMVFLAGIIFLFSLLYLVSYFRTKNKGKYHRVKLFFLLINVVLVVYLFVLATHIGIYYFDAPYQHYRSAFISLTSYIPIVLLLGILPLTWFNIRYVKSNGNRGWTNIFLIFNNVIYLVMILGFGYWGLLNVFH